VVDASKEDPTLERKLADDALRDSEARYRRLFETAQDGILILDAYSGLITDVNPFLISLLAYPREEFIGKTLWDIGPFKQTQESKAAFRELKNREHVRYETLRLETRSGGRVIVEFVSNVYRELTRACFMCAVESAGPLQVQVLPGSWFVPPGSNRSGGGGNKAVGASGAEGRYGDLASM
jgi:PAS domain S-box-containing protein